MDSFFHHMSIPMAVFGIGLVIFVHEAGHFIAARLCKVRVEVFSLGFGPRLLGLRRGHTLYQIAFVPLGGYVKMAGDEIDRDGRAPRDYELAGKSVGQRFFIYSGGVLMNVAFALVVFPFVLAAGVPSMEPMVDAPAPGSAAWHARIEGGSRVLSINDKEIFDFFQIPNEVALGGRTAAELELLPPGATQPERVTLRPDYSEDTGYYRIGVSPAPDPDGRILVAPDSAAAEAGLVDGDRVLGVEGAIPGLSVREQLYLALRTGEPVTLLVHREEGPEPVTITPRLGDEFVTRRLFGFRRQSQRPRLIGFEPAYVHLLDQRPNPVAAELGLQEGDRLLAVNGTPIHRDHDVLVALAGSREPVRFEIVRGSARRLLEGPALSPEQAVALANDLFVSIDLEDRQISVLPGSAAEAAGILSGDLVDAVDGTPVATWSEFQELAREASSEERSVVVTVERGAFESFPERFEFEVTPSVVLPPLYGFSLQTAEYVYKVDNVASAMRIGVSSSWRFMVEAMQSLRRMLTREVSTENLGGIITIGVVSESWASKGFAKLFFFLCILSMNLAFLNVLPIPILDGGHLFFLLVEKIKGSPVSERTLGYSQIVGLVLIMTLMVYVTYNDVARWFFDN